MSSATAAISKPAAENNRAHASTKGTQADVMRVIRIVISLLFVGESCPAWWFISQVG